MKLYNQGMFLQASVWFREAPSTYKWDWADYMLPENRDYIFVFA